MTKKYIFKAQAIVEAENLEQANERFADDFKHFATLARGEEFDPTIQYVEMKDDLDETADSVKEQVTQHFIDWLEQNAMPNDFDEYYQDTGADYVSECADGAVPVYNKDIDDLYYLRGNDLDEAYENAGIGDGNEDNHKAVTIYCYLSEAGYEQHRELSDLVDEHLDTDKEDEGKADLLKALAEVIENL